MLKLAYLNNLRHVHIFSFNSMKLSNYIIIFLSVLPVETIRVKFQRGLATAGKLIKFHVAQQQQNNTKYKNSYVKFRSF